VAGLGGKVVRRGGREGSSLEVGRWVVQSRREAIDVAVDGEVAVDGYGWVEDCHQRRVLNRRSASFVKLSHLGSTASTCFDHNVVPLGIIPYLVITMYRSPH
jgi:hypothetical protein